MATHTVNTMRENVGKSCKVMLEGWADVPCTILDAKSAYGCIRYYVQPIGGKNAGWVDSSRVSALA